MGTLERLVLRMADWNGTWWGLNWLRPAKAQRITLGRFVLLGFVLAAPGALAGMGLIFLVLGALDPVVGLIMSSALVLLQVILNAPLVYFWNKRAAEQGAGGSTRH
jgi:hypothetical protein